MDKDSAEFYRWLEDLDAELNQIALVWRGYSLQYDEQKATFVPILRPGSRPIMNETGTKEVIAILKEALTKNTTMSAPNEIQVNLVTRQTCLVINDLLFDNVKEYGLDESQYTRVMVNVMNFIYLALLRAQDGGERKLIGNATKTIESHTYSAAQPPQKKGGLFGFIRGGI
jgi:hypothetical protein